MTQSARPADEQLAQARADVTAEIARTDAKASALLTAFGIPFAALVAVVPGQNLPAAAAVLSGIGAVGLVAAMIHVLLVVRPRLGGTARGSYLHWADCTPEDVLADLAEDRRAERIVELSRIAKRKYRALKTAVEVTAASLALLVLALLAALALS